MTSLHQHAEAFPVQGLKQESFLFHLTLHRNKQKTSKARLRPLHRPCPHSNASTTLQNALSWAEAATSSPGSSALPGPWQTGWHQNYYYYYYYYYYNFKCVPVPWFQVSEQDLKSILQDGALPPQCSLCEGVQRTPVQRSMSLCWMG